MFATSSAPQQSIIGHFQAHVPSPPVVGWTNTIVSSFQHSAYYQHWPSSASIRIWEDMCRSTHTQQLRQQKFFSAAGPLVCRYKLACILLQQITGKIRWLQLITLLAHTTTTPLTVRTHLGLIAAVSSSVFTDRANSMRQWMVRPARWTRPPQCFSISYEQSRTSSGLMEKSCTRLLRTSCISDRQSCLRIAPSKHVSAFITLDRHRQLFNGLFSRTTSVSLHQKGKPIWIIGIAREHRGYGLHQAALVKGRQIGENCKKKSHEISDCKFHMHR